MLKHIFGKQWQNSELRCPEPKVDCVPPEAPFLKKYAFDYFLVHVVSCGLQKQVCQMGTPKMHGFQTKQRNKKFMSLFVVLTRIIWDRPIVYEFKWQGHSQPQSPGWGKSCTFLIFSLNFHHFFLFCLKFSNIFAFILVLQVGELPTWEGPGYMYATVKWTPFKRILKGAPKEA